MVEVHKRHFFYIWEHGEESPKKFPNKLNSFHPTISIRLSTQKKQLIF